MFAPAYPEHVQHSIVHSDGPSVTLNGITFNIEPFTDVFNSSAFISVGNNKLIYYDCTS